MAPQQRNDDDLRGDRQVGLRAGQLLLVIVSTGSGSNHNRSDTGAPIGSEPVKRALLSLRIVGYLTALSIGVDGHPIFQILAVESLGLGPRAIGVALGLGTLSIPVQIWAARIPLARARHNVRLFLVGVGAMALMTAGLIVGAEPGSWVAGLALVIAIVAEIAVSVLMAPAFQPLISYSLTPAQRPFMLGPAQALTGIVVLLTTALVGALDDRGRAMFLVVLAVAAFVVAGMLRVLPAPPASHRRPHVDTVDGDAESVDQAVGSGSGQNDDRRTIRRLYHMMPALAVGSWPLLVTYAALTLWPDGNLGLLGAALAGGSVVASFLWRDPGSHLIPLIRAATVVAALCTIGLVLLDAPIESGPGTATLLALAAVGSASRAVTVTGVMELIHRRIDTTNSVRVMTMVDVIGSTSGQLNLFVAGFLIAAAGSGPTPLAGLDVYEIWILVMSAVLMTAAARLRPRHGTLDPVTGLR